MKQMKVSGWWVVLALVLCAVWAGAISFTDVNNARYWGKTGIPALTEALDANFALIEAGTGMPHTLQTNTVVSAVASTSETNTVVSAVEYTLATNTIVYLDDSTNVVTNTFVYVSGVTPTSASKVWTATVTPTSASKVWTATVTPTSSSVVTVKSIP
jgi:hypothetical protein